MVEEVSKSQQRVISWIWEEKRPLKHQKERVIQSE